MESAETTPNGPAETANPIPKTPILEEVTPVQNPIKNTHKEIYTRGEERDGKERAIPTFHYIKMWCLK